MQLKQEKTFEDLGLRVPTILLPRQGIDLEKWAVVACDQHTSEPEYWKSVTEFVGDYPSTLDMMFPEVYLGKGEDDQRIAAINETMNYYLHKGVLVPRSPGFVVVDRELLNRKHRQGLMVALDLEQYDYRQGSQSLIRATEATIEDRLPPRIAIRKNAPIEMPHIMVLIDDPRGTVISAAYSEPELEERVLYDTQLMQGGGRVTGYHITDETTIDSIANALMQLKDEKTESTGQTPMLYAMGDGNHSLATAKKIWEDIKTKAGGLAAVRDHPARYALVELVNIHDKGLDFEAIHRVVFSVNDENIFKEMQKFYAAQGSEFTQGVYSSEESLAARIKELEGQKAHVIRYITRNKRYGLLVIKNPKALLPVETLQKFLDDYLQKREAQGLILSKIDYIHGDNETAALAAQPNNIGFLLSSMQKDELFQYVAKNGPVPRKTFSLGHAHDKRYYMEARMIVQ
ncbi:DUF1015 domain-containing protein [Candidatus Woesearchaeota archaeon]|nr:DUF1015 domain-containing protein [Candidatus Woesearchaeota archaeon]